ncbi:MAG: 5-(carboxyamino)imidazole ribonucleotide synthase [Stellaceae bacterium]|jgi:5-(carboxyamino)imidazole ribonucleotide synthase
MIIAPGSTIGILGGGQLGRMTALAAARLGYRCHVFGPERDSPAKQVAALSTTAQYSDQAALRRFARGIDVATFEFENVDVEAARFLARLKPLRPGPNALEIAQDRLKEKNFLRGIGISTADYYPVRSAASLAQAMAALGSRAILKTVRFGYDGKGQLAVEKGANPAASWKRFGAKAGILEGRVDFACEVSVIVARGLDGKIEAYTPVENRHYRGILDTTSAPARIPKAVAREATRIAVKAAKKLDVVGLLAVEMFVTKQGRVLVNELAPRPHNSGHWTMDACITSQFEQLVRAICGLPLGSPERHSDAVMKNLIGAEVKGWRAALRDPGAKLHLYGKGKPVPGRKMGHVTRLKPKS